MEPIDLNEYRKTHGPAVRCLVAAQRAWWKWAMLPWEIICSSTKRKDTPV